MDHQLRTNYEDQLAIEIESMLDPVTGDILEDLVEECSCPLCDSSINEQEILFRKRGFYFRRCLNCQLILTNPRLKSDYLHDSYRNAESNKLWVEIQKSALEKAWKTPYYQDCLELISANINTKAPRICDVGCGIGHFLELAKEKWPDCRTVGLEINKESVKIARNRGIQIHEGIISELSGRDDFTLVTAHGVLEHLPNPKDFLSDVRRLLAGGGYFFAIVPNIFSLYHMILGEKSVNFDGRDHVLHFSESTLSRLLCENGFKIIHLDTVLTGFGAITRSIQWLPPYDDTRTTKEYLPQTIRSLIEDETSIEELIKTHNLGLRLRILGQME